MGAKRKSSSKSERGTPVKKPNAAGVEPIISKPAEETSSSIEEEDIIAERCNLHLHSELPVIAMAYSTKVKRLCVLRRMEQENTNADGTSQKLLTSIEFYNAANPPLIFLEKSIPLFNSLNSLFWMTSWAVLGGTGGNLYFFSPYTSKYAKMQISSTELTSLVRLSNEEFVVANNSGDVTLFSRHKQDLDEEENLLPRIMGHTLVKLSADSHILSLACSKKSPNQMIAIGQVNSITLFALQSMRRHDIKIPSLKNKSTVIWSMVFVDDVLFVGDSLGQVTLYNAVNGLLLKTFKSHQNDVLSLAMDGANVFSSGADSRIQVFARSGNSKQIEWQEVGQRLFHTKDVRSLCVLSTKWLVSGGYDGFYISGKHAFCKPHLRPECAFSNKQGLLLTRNPTSIDVWYKPQQDTKILANSVLRYEVCRLWPKLLTRIAIGTLGFVKQATISPNGCFLAFVGNINGTIMVLQLPKDFAAKVIESAKNNGKTTQQMKRQKEEPPANGFIQKYWSNRSEQESGEAVGGGRAVSAIFCTDNFLFYVLGEYSLFRLDLATKKTEMFATAKGGHITKIGANQLGTLVVALTTDGSALLFRLDPPNPYQFSPPSSMSTATPLIRDQAAYDCAFLGESRVLLLTSDLVKHLVCFDLTKMGECFVLSATDLHLCEMESIAYMDVVATEQTQILATTNKGRVLTLNVADIDSKPAIFISGQSEDLKLLPGKLDSRIEPFWGRKEESGRCREIVLVAHVEEAQIRQNKKK